MTGPGWNEANLGRVVSGRRTPFKELPMPTNASTKSKRAAGRKTKRAPGRTSQTDAITLLKQDHRQVEELFEKFEDLEDVEKKGELAAKICQALKVHTQIEEEIFYPAARKATGDNDLLDEAAVEHSGAKHLIGQIEAMEPGEDLYDAKIRVLSEQIKHHVEEEEEELFPEVEKSKMDTAAVGEQLVARKNELMSEAGATTNAE
jgi:hemerythrin superfamily protein